MRRHFDFDLHAGVDQGRHHRGIGRADMAQVIVQHRAKPDASADYANGTKGYLREEDVVDFVQSQGFELVGKSEANANPADSADWENGVWTLPPSLALKDQDRAKYEGIGESDRMTLLFRKRP